MIYHAQADPRPGPMQDQEPHEPDPPAEELLRRALVDADAAAAVALQVHGLPVADTVTVIFHGRRDLATVQTYITNGGGGAGAAVPAPEPLAGPCAPDPAEGAGASDAGRPDAQAGRDARTLAERLEHQEASVERFLELNADEAADDA